MEDRISQLTEFLRETPNDPFLEYALTMEYLKLGDVESARAGFERLLVEHEDYIGSYYHFGKLLEKLGDTERALKIYEKGMEVAKSKRNMHAFGELRAAYQLALGMEEDDDDI